MTETIATYSVEPSDDRDFTLEEIQAIADDAIAFELTELEQLNLKVAAIAGWENIKEWNPSHKPKKVFQGTNKKHPELGIFVPDYTRDLDAIAPLVAHLVASSEISLAHALCKLLLELAPNLPKFELEVQVIDDDGDIDEPTVIEATFE